MSQIVRWSPSHRPSVAVVLGGVGVGVRPPRRRDRRSDESEAVFVEREEVSARLAQVRLHQHGECQASLRGL